MSVYYQLVLRSATVVHTTIPGTWYLQLLSSSSTAVQHEPDHNRYLQSHALIISFDKKKALTLVLPRTINDPVNI